MEAVVLKLVTLVSALLALLMPARIESPEYTTALLRAGDTTIEADIAETSEQKTLGLSGRELLEDGKGMLFVYPEEGFYSFWMKDMNFPIDILWLSATLEVVHLEENVSPESYPESFVSNVPAQFVLELPADFAREHDIVLGTIFEREG
jgi:uncharacterized membrane protein (UPF0127 family)